MKKLTLILWLLSCYAAGQTLTNVTATLTDSSSTVWSSATWTAEFSKPVGGSNVTYSNGGHPITPNQSGVTNSSGVFNVTLDDNIVGVKPGGTAWRFTICPNASVVSCNVITLTITGATLNISAQLNAILVVPVVNSNSTISRAYSDSEVSGAFGTLYINSTTGTLKQCQSITCVGSGWATIGGGGIGVPGGAVNSIQTNNSGLFGGITNVAAGSILASAGAGNAPVFQTKAISDARDLGMDCTGVADSQAIWAGLSNTQVLLPAGCTVKIGSNLTTPSNVTIQFTQGAQLAPTTGVTVSVLGSVIAGNRQQIVNIANGTITFSGSKDIYVGWYGAPQNGVADDAPGTNAALVANPGKNIWMLKTNAAPCSSGAGGGCIGTIDGVFNSQVLVPENVNFGGNVPAGYAGGAVLIKCSTSLTVACVWAQANSFTTIVHDLYLDGGRGWNSTNLATFDLPAAMDGAGPDGFLFTNGRPQFHDIAANNFERHGVAIIGNGTVAGDNATGQPDFFKATNITSNGNRGWGIYMVGGDSNAGYLIAPETTGNQFGGVFDNSQLGNTIVGGGSHVDNRSAVSAGATSNISSITGSAGTVTVVMASGVTGLLANFWITVAGTTNYNGTFRLTSFTDTSHFQFALAGTFATETVGTISTASSTSVFAAYRALGGQFGKTGAYASNDGSNSSVWINPYCESTSNYPMWGITALILGGDQGHGCLFNLPANTDVGGVLMSPISHNLQVYASQGLTIKSLPLTNATLALQSFAPTDNIGELVSYLDHTGTPQFRAGMYGGAANYYAIVCSNSTIPFEIDHNSSSWLSSCGASNFLNLQANSTGNINFYNQNNPPLKITNTGQVQSGDAQGFGSYATNSVASACEATFAATTLSTVAATTDTTNNCLPANSIIDAVVYRIITTITTAATFQIGDATTSGRFSGALSSTVCGGANITAGQAGVCFVQADQTGAAGPRQVTAAKVRVTLNATPGAGTIRIIVYYHTWNAPTG